ncbi:MAG: exopolyphosphatase [Bacteroidia bacterium]|nr:exopolyphosphatase [Bacteroidia bacterium]
MPQNIAIIDLGTNTFNLLIATVSEHNTTIVHTTKQAVQLGKSTIGQNIINSEAQHRAIKALQYFVLKCKEYKVTSINAFATSAVRTATNCTEFCKAVKATTNIDIQVIDGLQEAEYIYQGVRKAVNMPITSNTLIMDIGGGSTEFIICNSTAVLWKQSYNIGIARLLAKFEPQEILTSNQKETILQYLKEQLTTLTEAIHLHQPTTLIGSSGSFDTFADMLLLAQYQPILTPTQTNYTFDIADLKQLFTTLYTSTYAQRLAINGMLALRAEMIVLAALCTEYIIDEYNFEHMQLSTYALKEGVLFSSVLAK